MGITFQKIAGGILFALILVVGIGLVADAVLPVGQQVAQAPAPAAAPPEAEAEAPAEATTEEPAQAAAMEETAEAVPEATAEAEPEAAPAPAADAGAAPAAGGALAMIATADVAAGQTAAKKCAACHTFDEGGANRVGPNLHGIVGADIATREGFKYSGALTGLEGTWTYEALDAFLTKPATYAKGTRMVFAGLPNDKERAALLAYLRSISPNAPPPPG